MDHATMARFDALPGMGVFADFIGNKKVTSASFSIKSPLSGDFQQRL
jgi:hypothetical protein